MHKDRFGEIVFSESDLCDLVMQGHDITTIPQLVVDPAFDLEQLVRYTQDPGSLLTWTFPESSDISVPDYDLLRQQQWFMPDHYKTMDIAKHLLDLCQTQDQLQRVGQELLMFQERGMFDLLRYMKYLVDVMQQNHVIWGVGRGSCVASYVLYLLGVHRIDSMFYDLDPGEFLR